jgi:hypothetical protein
METKDPRAEVLTGTVTNRAAAARDLATVGTWEDLPSLVALGWSDKSTSVRLYTAAAAADIIGRERGAYGQGSLSPAQRDQVFEWAFGGDPGRNPSMLMLASAIDEPRTLGRLARILRDPRSDVRFGAVTAVRRMVLGATAQRARIAAAIGEWLADPRTPVDARAELVKLIGEAGLSSLRAAVTAASSINEGFAEVRALTLERLAAAEGGAALAGGWWSDGRDVFESGEARGDAIAVGGAGGWYEEGAQVELVKDGAGWRIGGEPAAVIWAIPLGATEPRRAAQWAGRTWWSLAGKDLAELVCEQTGRVQALGSAAALAVLEALAEVEGVVAERARPIARWLAGQPAEALDELDALNARKKPTVELHWWRARMLLDLGRSEEAAAELREFRERSKGKGAWAAEAQALLATLGG